MDCKQFPFSLTVLGFELAKKERTEIAPALGRLAVVYFRIFTTRLLADGKFVEIFRKFSIFHLVKIDFLNWSSLASTGEYVYNVRSSCQESGFVNLNPPRRPEWHHF